MTYDELMTILSTRHQHHIKLGLDSIAQLLNALDNPHQKLSYIHVAGTNGKGTMVNGLHQQLIANDVRVGSFISPCIAQVNEQIKINDQLIDDETLATYAQRVDQANQTLEHSATDFELLVALALLYFSHQAVDLVIMEVGLGGRQDATNIIPPPLVHIITQIDIDHTDFLSGDLETIAKEKAGIIKSNRPTICYPATQVVEKVLVEKAKEYDSPIWFAKQEESIWATYETMMKQVLLSLENEWEFLFKKFLSFEEINPLPARMERLSNKPKVILDGAHNEAALMHLLDQVLQDKSSKKIAVFGMLNNKTMDKLFDQFPLRFDRIILTQPMSDRATKPDELVKQFNNQGVTIDRYFDDCIDAVKYALSIAKEEEAIYIFGSFYLAKPIKEWFSLKDKNKIDK